MANKTTFIAQAFERKRGKLVPTSKDVAPTANGAKKRAEALSKRVPGTAAISVTADDETGELRRGRHPGQIRRGAGRLRRFTPAVAAGSTSSGAATISR